MSATKAQRIKHLPTGLYYIPSREVQIRAKLKDGTLYHSRCKSNLSKTGKVYVRGASFKFIGSFYSHVEAQKQLQRDADMEKRNDFLPWRRVCLCEFDPNEWIIEDFNN